MTQVLIDRELLERAASMELDTTARSIRTQDELRALLARPAQHGEAVEVAQVVSYLSACADGYDPDAPHPGPPEPLMTVAQHQRILSASVPAGCKVVPVELLERLEHVTRTLVPHLQCHVDLRALLASVEGGE